MKTILSCDELIFECSGRTLYLPIPAPIAIDPNDLSLCCGMDGVYFTVGNELSLEERWELANWQISLWRRFVVKGGGEEK